MGMKLNVLCQTCALAGPTGAFAMNTSLVSVKRERPMLDSGPDDKSVAVAGC